MLARMPDDVAHDLSRMKFVPRQGTFIPSNPVKEETVPCYATSERIAGMAERPCPQPLGPRPESRLQAVAGGENELVAARAHLPAPGILKPATAPSTADLRGRFPGWPLPSGPGASGGPGDAVPPDGVPRGDPQQVG